MLSRRQLLQTSVPALALLAAKTQAAGPTKKLVLKGFVTEDVSQACAKSRRFVGKPREFLAAVPTLDIVMRGTVRGDYAYAWTFHQQQLTHDTEAFYLRYVDCCVIYMLPVELTPDYKWYAVGDLIWFENKNKAQIILR